MKVVVTGATGFIGSHLVPALLNAGCEVSGIAGPGENEPIRGIKTALVDISSAGEFPETLFKADTVIHLAARNHVLKETVKDPLAAYRRVNVEGTRNVIRAAADSRAKLFLHLSSVKAMGEESENIFDEESLCSPKTPYGISKLESEEIVRAESKNSGMKAIILRLPMVYGPRNRGNLPRMIRWADGGLPFPLFQPDNLRSMIYVENVVAGILAVLKSPSAGVSTYILKDREDYSTCVVYSAICRALGKKPRFLPIPATAVRLGGMLSEDFRKIASSLRVSSAKIREEIGFVPPIFLEEGITRTVQWYKHSAR